MGDSVKGFTKVWAENIHSLSLIHWVGHQVIEGDQVGQAGPAFREPTLAGPDPLAVLHLPGELTQDEPFHNLPWYQGYADRHAVLWIRLSALLVDGHHISKPLVIWDLPC